MADNLFGGLGGITEGYQKELLGNFGGDFNLNPETGKLGKTGGPQEMKFVEEMGKTAKLGRSEDMAPAKLQTPLAFGTTNSTAVGKLVGEFIGKVDDAGKKAHTEFQKFVTGESNNLHRVMAAKVEEKLHIQLMVEIRNALTEGLRELNRSVS